MPDHRHATVKFDDKPGINQFPQGLNRAFFTPPNNRFVYNETIIIRVDHKVNIELNRVGCQLIEIRMVQHIFRNKSSPSHK